MLYSLQLRSITFPFTQPKRLEKRVINMADTAADKKIAELEKQLAKSNEDVARLQRHHEKMSGMCRNYQTAANDAAKRLADAIRERDEARAQLAAGGIDPAVVTALRKEVGDLTDQLKAANGDKVTLVRERDEALRERDKARAANQAAPAAAQRTAPRASMKGPLIAMGVTAVTVQTRKKGTSLLPLT